MLKHHGILRSHALRYLEFDHFNERDFLQNFVNYLKSVHYTDDVMVRDVGRRKGPDGHLYPKSEVCLHGTPSFEVVSHTASSCFIGATRKRAGIANEAILDAFLNQYVQPKVYMELRF